jgi:FlaA1/EpsC-like NDP-sugar epimerase
MHSIAKSYRIVILLAADCLLVSAALYCAALLRFDGGIPVQTLHTVLPLVPLVIVVNLGFFLAFKFYSRVWEYASIGELFSLLKATTCSLIVLVAVIEIFPLPQPPHSLYLLGWIMINIFIGASRLWWRLLRDFHLKSQRHHGKRVLIVGAGDAGAMLVREIQSNPDLGLEAVALVDDDPDKRGKMMLELSIWGDRYEIPSLVRALDVEEIIIAMPSVKGRAISEIVAICKNTPVSLRILPSIYQSSPGSLLNQVRMVQMEDLLGRDAVDIDLGEVSAYVQGKTVMVTGAGGSIGSELCRQIGAFQPRRLVILENCENNLFEIEMELNDAGLAPRLTVELVDVKHRDHLEATFRKYRPQVVFHAAAYKHVPMMELHPEAALRNNVLGTCNTAEMADKYATEIFILISTDKAVNPTSIMGASKRLAELVIKDINRSSATRFAAVRFGNVLGSRGSVIPTFQKQIERGGPVTVTHPDMKRYFMTIPEAVELVIQAGAMARGGETFVLDMGDPVNIADMARDLIKLYGYTPGRDIEIAFTGIRPGEKLYEELFSDREDRGSTPHERIFISRKEMDDNYIGLSQNIPAWIQNAFSDKNAIINLISGLIPEYRKPEYISSPEPSGSKADVVYLPENHAQKKRSS